MKKLMLFAGTLVVLVAAVLFQQPALASTDDVSFVGRGTVIEEIAVSEDATEVRIERTEGNGVLQEVEARGFDWDLASGSAKVDLFRKASGEAVTLKVTVKNPGGAGARSTFRVRTRGTAKKVELPSASGGLNGTIAWGDAPPVGDGLLGVQVARKISGDLNIESDFNLGWEDHSAAETTGVGPWSPGAGWNGRLTVGPAWRPEQGVHMWAKGGVALGDKGKLAKRPVILDLGVFAPLDPYDGVFEWGGKSLAQFGQDSAVGLEGKGYYSLLKYDWFVLMLGVKVETKLAASRYVTIIPELQEVCRTPFGTLRGEQGYGLDSWTGQPAARIGVSLLPY